jgi:hypothetical protein
LAFGALSGALSAAAARGGTGGLVPMESNGNSLDLLVDTAMSVSQDTWDTGGAGAHYRAGTGDTGDNGGGGGNGGTSPFLRTPPRGGRGARGGGGVSASEGRGKSGKGSPAQGTSDSGSREGGAATKGTYDDDNGDDDDDNDDDDEDEDARLDAPLDAPVKEPVKWSKEEDRAILIGVQQMKKSTGGGDLTTETWADLVRETPPLADRAPHEVSNRCMFVDAIATGVCCGVSCVCAVHVVCVTAHYLVQYPTEHDSDTNLTFSHTHTHIHMPKMPG